MFGGRAEGGGGEGCGDRAGRSGQARPPRRPAAGKGALFAGCPDDRSDCPEPSPSHPQDDAQIAPLKPGDTVLVSALHSAPSGDRTGAAVDVTLPARINRSGLSPRQLRAVRFLQFTCGVPEPVIHAAMRTKKRTLATLAAWCVAWYWAIR